MTDTKPQRRRFYPTPGWLVLGLLVVEGLLWLSQRLSGRAVLDSKVYSPKPPPPSHALNITRIGKPSMATQSEISPHATELQLPGQPSS
jgi:hypothetical protein